MLTLEVLRDPGTVIKNPPVGVNQNFVYCIKETGDTFEVTPEKKEFFLKRFEAMRERVRAFTNAQIKEFITEVK